jgi:hypothetical protein
MPGKFTFGCDVVRLSGGTSELTGNLSEDSGQSKTSGEFIFGCDVALLISEMSVLTIN